MNNVLLAKQELREKIKVKRSTISKQNWQPILNNIRVILAKKKPRKIFAYFEREHEVPISLLFPTFISEGRKFYLPYLNKNVWGISEVVKDQAWEKNSLGIIQPENPSKNYSNLKEIPFEKGDIAFVPGIAFSKTGERLGSGKGIYDKYLETINCYKVGVCYEYQVLTKIPQEPHDVSIDLIVTERPNKKVS